MTDSSLNPSLRELLNGVSGDVQLLFSQTVALARLEVSAAASKLAWSGVGVLASLFVAVVGTAVLVSALVLSLIALGLPAWAASTLVGLVLTAGGALSARSFVRSGFITSAVQSALRRIERTRETCGLTARI
jgi:Putative Actinobacterial Holin-X, holin superfamily III